MALAVKPISLALGPIYFNWPSERLEDFYARIADEAPVDRVYIGEVVCGKRAPLTAVALGRAAERLRRAGKTVVWSGLISPVNKRERRMTRELMEAGDEVEINDFGGLKDRTGPFTAGPFLNLYSEGALALMEQLGCVRWCPRVELSLEAVSTIARAVPGVEAELFGFGRLPLAHSGRCYHARQHGLTKDSCQYICERDPDGASIETLDGEPVLAYNGVQTLSHGVQVCAVGPGALREAGIGALRLSPHSVDMVQTARAFRRYLDGETERDALVAELEAQMPDWAMVDGYLAGQPGRRWMAL